MEFPPLTPLGTLEGFVGGNVGRVVHGYPIIASITCRSRIFMMVEVGKVIA